MSDLSPLVIVGGAGNMGAFFADFFRAGGLTVEIVEAQCPVTEKRQRLAKANSVIVSVPISSTVKVIEEIIPWIAPTALLADFTSIKEPAMAAMAKHSGEVLGLHPMFAPIKTGITGQTIVVCRERAGQRAEALCRLFTQGGARLLSLSAAKHDKLMAVVQGMNHFHSIVFAHALSHLDISVDDMVAVASPGYAIQLQLIGRILAQDPQLYIDIQLCNPHVVTALEAFQGSSSRFFSAIRDGSPAECKQFFAEAVAALGAYSDSARKESDLLFSYVSSRKLS